ncbi:hypothetical protein [Candidatus Magnetobacterium casense]|uniref:hypothetical protein n=1 Tax=Candidatus Magnetobacterium casense TaxID=1455061 RepID=UPI00058BD380|nr:hypothetical protein [Candidatus Magnetobacterium casensis]
MLSNTRKWILLISLLLTLVPQGAYSATTSALISSDDAVKIAEGFIKSKEAKEGYEDWNGASVLDVQPFYSSNDVVIAYEVLSLLKGRMLVM